MRAKIRLILFHLFLTGIVGCEKFVDIAPPETMFYSEAMFNDADAVVSAVNGLYAQMAIMPNTIAAGGLSLYGGLSADELIYTGVNEGIEAFARNRLTSMNESILYGNLWRPAYNMIYHANKIKEGIEKGNIPENVSDHLLGEVLVIRTLHYFYLINLFGDAPLILGTDFSENSIHPRNNTTEVYSQLITDLERAVLLLNTDYPSTERVRINRYAAHALLARISLYAGDAAKAYAHANTVIESGLYVLEETGKAFLHSSREAILQLKPMSLYMDTPEGNTFQPFAPGYMPGYIFRAEFITSFEQGDDRFSEWVGISKVEDTDYYFPNKFKIKFGGPPYQEYTMVLRLGEQYLIRAEASFLLANNEDAIADLNTIRHRASLPDLSVNTEEQVRDAIVQERRTELFAEWGQRWLDIKRWGIADDILKDLKSPDWSSVDVLYPIPFTELQANPFLSQNPGY